MRLTRLAAASAFIFLLACRDNGDKGGQAPNTDSGATAPSNESPEASIEQPGTGDGFYSDQLITFEGTVSDPEDAADSLRVEWESSLDGVLDLTAVPDSDGRVSSEGTLSEGEHTLELRVEDSEGETGSATVLVEVGPANTPPECQITSPETNSADEEGVVVRFEGRVSDVDITSEALTVVWTSDIDGTLDDSSPTEDGEVGFSSREHRPGREHRQLRLCLVGGRSCIHRQHQRQPVL